MEKIICCNYFNQIYDIMYLKISIDSNLNDLRKALEKKRKFDTLFFLTLNGNYFSKEEEKKIMAFDYFKNKVIYFSEEDYISIKLNGQFLYNIKIENIPLNKLRQQLSNKIVPNNKFFLNNAFILDEENFTVFDICKYNAIEINKIQDIVFNKLKVDEIFIDKETKFPKDNNNNINILKNEANINNLRNSYFKNDIEASKLELNEDENLKLKDYLSENKLKPNKNTKRNKSIGFKKRNEKHIKYQLFFNGKKMEDFPFFECSPNTKLLHIKEHFPSKYKDYCFLYEGYPIINEETKISEIAKDNKIFLKYEDQISFKQKKYTKLNKKSIYEYYLYPNIKFNEEEEKECISLLLVGQTGTGKTTFLNSLINFILKVNYSDIIRYLLVDENNYEKYLSQTKEVNIYHIKSHNSFPPIKIIDTPGFGDTSGIEFDKKIVKMIYEKFKEIKDLNSVCILLKHNEVRFDYSQRYIFNYIIDLFGKDMAENFMILFSFCDIGEISSKKCFEGKDSLFNKIISKIKEPWYLKFNNSGYFAEKKNNIIEEFYKMGNESFMKLISKLKSLKKIKLELSSEVNIKREKMDKITSYIHHNIIYLANLMLNKSYINSSEFLIVYYCWKCSFFSSSNKCIVCDNILTSEYGNKFFNFKEYSSKADNLLLKYYLEIFSDLFKLESLMKEYNNITLRDSQETIKEFISQIIKENSQKQNISSNILHIKSMYEKYIYEFKNKNISQSDFPKYLFNQLIK